MSMWGPAKVIMAAQVDANVAFAVVLPDGPGYYRLVRVGMIHASGANAATFRPLLSDNSTAGIANQVWTPNAAIAVANPALYPGNNADADPGKYGYAEDGTWSLLWGANVVGDTYSGSIIVIRLR